MAIKIKNKLSSANKRNIAIFTVVILIFVSASTVWALSKPNPDNNEIKESSKKDIESNKDTNKESGRHTNQINNTNEINSTPNIKNTDTNSDTPPPVEEPADNSDKAEVMMSVSHDISSDSLNIRGGIDNAVVYEGDCVATLTGPDGIIIKKSTTLLQNPRNTDCQTISIPLEELSRGEWKIKLNYESSNYQGESDEDSFTIN